VWSKVPAGVLLVFGWVEKLLINALSITNCNHACKMFTYYSSSITASSESNVQHQRKFHTDISYSVILRISPHATYTV